MRIRAARRRPDTRIFVAYVPLTWEHLSETFGTHSRSLQHPSILRVSRLKVDDVNHDISSCVARLEPSGALPVHRGLLDNPLHVTLTSAGVAAPQEPRSVTATTNGGTVTEHTIATGRGHHHPLPHSHGSPWVVDPWRTHLLRLRRTPDTSTPSSNPRVRLSNLRIRPFTPKGPTTSTANLTSETDPLGHQAACKVRPANRLTEATLANGRTRPVREAGSRGRFHGRGAAAIPSGVLSGAARAKALPRIGSLAGGQSARGRGGSTKFRTEL